MNSAHNATRWRRNALAIACLGYTAAALGVDSCIALGVSWPVNWGQWRPYSDWFKLAAWLGIPVAASLRGMDWGYLGVRRWRRGDAAFLGAACVLAAAVVATIPFVPGLADLYQGLAGASPEQKWRFASGFLVWLAFWLPGWEFLHRYFLLRAADAAWPRWGWLLVPAAETLYHVQKPVAEMTGMLVFSLAATWWARRRRNLLLPFLAHLAIELALLTFLLIT